MYFLDVLFSFLLAVLLAFLLISIFRIRAPGPASGFAFLLAMLFLVIWATGSWVGPVGPTFFGISWLSLLIIGAIFALILAASMPVERGPYTKAEAVESSAARETATILNAFFWVVIFFLLLLSLARYWYPIT